MTAPDDGLRADDLTMVEIERLVHAGLTAGETIRRIRAALAARLATREEPSRE